MSQLYTFKFTSRLVGALLIAIKIYSGRIILTLLCIVGKMSSRKLYSEVVSSSGISDAENSAGHSIINWMQAYQTEPEELALKQCLELSKV